MAKSMTEGRPFRLILRFALPLLVGNLLQQTYNMIDAAIVGQVLGSDGLAAVGATSSAQFLILGFCLGMCTGFGVPVASSFGANDTRQMKDYIAHAMLIAAVLAVVMTSLCVALCPTILRILSVPEDIFADTYSYLVIIFLGIPFIILYNLLASILRSVGDSRTPFVFLAISTVLNIFLDILCVAILPLGCAGAAIATVVAQGISGLLCLVYIWKKVPLLHPERMDGRFRARPVKRLLAMGLPMGFQFSVTAIGSMTMQSANNALGSIYVSGFTAGNRIKQFVMCPFDAIATATSVFCSQNLGAGKTDRITKGFREGLALAVGYGVIAGIVLIFAGRTLSLLFVSSDEVEILDASGKYLRYIGVFFWTLGFLNVSRLTTQGLGFSGRAIFSGVIEMIARVVVSRVFVPIAGFTAICCADQAAWIAAILYIVPMCFYCIAKVRRQVREK
ncbi:MAG: MATE family efflux transporter [Lachnospiraceae bacterium]|nr:MATE family efflux transporter [Lachnospiraceae bacterium]